MRLEAIILGSLLAAAAPPDAIVVKREGARVMAAPRFFGEACAVKVSPGETLRLAERRGGWARLEAPGAGKCWLHESAWVDRAAGELAGGGAAASRRDVELAARGFSEEEEADYRRRHPDLAPRFEIVDAYVERAPEPSAGELQPFLARGRLGGAK